MVQFQTEGILGPQLLSTLTNACSNLLLMDNAGCHPELVAIGSYILWRMSTNFWSTKDAELKPCPLVCLSIVLLL